MTSRRSPSTDQVGTLSKIGWIMSAPVGYRDTDARMLLCKSAVGQTWGARWPHTNSTSVRSLASGPSKQLPHNGREFEYRIKSASEEHERVAGESELTRP